MKAPTTKVGPAKTAKKSDSAALNKAQSALEEQQNAFNEVTKESNTLQRNIVLAEHRAEIARLQKLIAKSTV